MMPGIDLQQDCQIAIALHYIKIQEYMEVRAGQSGRGLKTMDEIIGVVLQLYTED